MLRAENYVKIFKKFAISNPKPDLHNINVHIKFGENPLTFTLKLSNAKENTDKGMDSRMDGQTTNVIHKTLPLLCGGV